MLAGISGPSLWSSAVAEKARPDKSKVSTKSPTIPLRIEKENLFMLSPLKIIG